MGMIFVGYEMIVFVFIYVLYLFVIYFEICECVIVEVDCVVGDGFVIVEVIWEFLVFECVIKEMIWFYLLVYMFL